MSSPAERLGVALADRYRIERELGQGGMATVYQAHDLRHDRDVAIKVLHPDLGAALGSERFLSEIRTTARLQHPHILPLLDSGEADDLLYYVMPLVTGETLRTRLERERQLPIDDAVQIAREVADALGHAHSLGVIHRDIKPENILLQGGHALVADFGIALAVQSAGGQRLTQTGLSLGTPQYMSPEQAMGEKHIDARSDIYALGAVTYEMLVGEAPFTGPSVQAIVARLATEDPRGLVAQRKAVPEHVEAAVLRALEKLPADRFAMAADYGNALIARGAITPMPRARAGAGARRRTSIVAVSGWAVAAAAIGVAAWSWNREVDQPTARQVVGFPQGQALDISADGTHLAVTRDGSVMVYVAGDSTDTRLYVKERDKLAAVPLPGTEGAYNPFISPDGQQVAFFNERGGRALYRISLSGGLPQVVYRGLLGTSGGSWGGDGFLYIDTDWEGLQRIRPDGTGREMVMALDTLQREIGYAWPEVLHGTQVVIARLRRAADTPEAFDIVAGRIGTRERVTVTRAVTARYLEGHLVFATADGTLLAARFDLDRLALSGTPVVLATGVRVAGTFAGVDLAVTDGGSVMYVGGPAGLRSQFEWVSADGVGIPVDSTWHLTGLVWDFALSPDGSRIAVSMGGAGSSGTHVWVKQIPTGPFTRIAGPRAFDASWSGDSRWIYYASRREEPYAVYRRRADGIGGDSLAVRAPGNIGGTVASRDGRWMLATVFDSGTPRIHAMEVGRDTMPKALIASTTGEWGGALSPDGRWMAYVSQSSGRPEVHVRPFPDVDAGLWQISVNGGHEPRWARSGKSLFFRELGAGSIMVVDIVTAPDFGHSAPRVALRATPSLGILPAEGFDVSADDRRFLVVTRGAAVAAAHLVRIDNVMAELRRGTAP